MCGHRVREIWHEVNYSLFCGAVNDGRYVNFVRILAQENLSQMGVVAWWQSKTNTT